MVGGGARGGGGVKAPQVILIQAQVAGPVTQ